EGGAEGSGGRDAAGQFEEGLEPIEFGAAVVGDLHPVVGPAEDGAGGDEDDLVEAVDPALFAAGIGQVGEMIDDGDGAVGRGSGGRVGLDGHGADVPEELGLSWRSMVQEAPDPRPAGLYRSCESLFPRAPRRPRLMRKPCLDAPDQRPAAGCLENVDSGSPFAFPRRAGAWVVSLNYASPFTLIWAQVVRAPWGTRAGRRPERTWQQARDWNARILGSSSRPH